MEGKRNHERKGGGNPGNTLSKEEERRDTNFPELGQSCMGY